MSMEFEAAPVARTSSYLDSPEQSIFHDNSMDYLQFGDGASPSFDASMSLPSTASPLTNYSALGLTNSVGEPYGYNPVAFTDSPPRSYSPATIEGISPPMLSSYQLTAGDVSDDSQLSSGRRSRAGGRSLPYSATVPRSAVRYNPMSVPPARSSTRSAVYKRRNSRSSADKDSDAAEEDEEEYQPHSSRGGSDPRREEIRKQRIDSEQRRRDDLRDSFGSLKAVLPPSSQKASKIVVIERAIQHIREQTAKLAHAEQRIRDLSAAVERERALSEQLSLKNLHQLQNRYVAQDNSLPVSLGSF